MDVQQSRSLSPDANQGAKARVSRSSYRHVDLRCVLLDAGIELARAGGPQAVVLREATRRARVTPNAAYRHFSSRNALLQMVRFTALQKLSQAIEADLHALPPGLSPVELARASVRAVMAGYLRFARAEPGLYCTAFGLTKELHTPTADQVCLGRDLNHLQWLNVALDLLVEAGVMPIAQRQGAEITAWAAINGLAILVVDGPLRHIIQSPQMNQLSKRLVEMVSKGLEP